MFRTLCALLAVVAPAAASVLVVNGDSTVLQAAIDAAADGDILLIKPGGDGLFASVVVDGKGLTLAVEGGTYELGHLSLRNLPAGSQLIVHGLVIDSPLVAFTFPFTETGALEIRDCLGPVRIEECSVATPQQSSGGFGVTQPGFPGVLVVNSPNVALTDCTIVGGLGATEAGSCTIPGYAPSSVGGPGLQVRDSRVALHDVTALGGAGGGPGGGCPQGSSSPGGPGARVQGTGRVLAADSNLRGANDTAAAAGPGAGLVVEGAGTLTQRGGSISQGSGLPAAPPIIAPPGAVTSYAAPPRGLAITSPIRVAGNGVLTIDGVAGETCAVFESPAGGWAELPGKQGVLLLGAPLIGPILILANPTGTLSLPFTTPPVLPPGVDGMSIHLQLFCKLGAVVTVEDIATCTVVAQGL